MNLSDIESKFPDAEVLTPLQLNSYRFSGRHTPLTPEMLAKTLSVGTAATAQPDK